MRKIILLIFIFFGTGISHAFTLTDPIVNLGTITDNAPTPGVWTFTVTGGASANMTNTGGSTPGSTWSGWSYTAFNASDLTYGGKKKYIWISVNPTNPTPEDDPNCGVLTITNLQVKPNAIDPLNVSFAKKNGNPVTIRDYPNGIFFPFNVTVTPYSNKGTCTITKVYNIFNFAEGTSGEVTTDYTPFTITFSITLITPVEEVSLEHDEGESLSFGTIIRSNQTQTITVDPSGTASSSSPSYVPSADVSADSFTVEASSSVTFSVTLPSSVTISSGGNSMTVTSLTSSCDGGGCSVSGGGSTTFTVGGTLTVPANQPVGEYNGNYSVSVTY